MIKQKIFNRRTCALLLAVLLMLELVFVSPLITHAADEVTSFDNTNIEDDLVNVDLSNFPKNPLGESEIISVMEYAYSDQTYNAEHYALYIYVYNPTGKAISTSGDFNKVNICVGSASDVQDFENVALEYLDRTADNLFYKFKLSNSRELLAKAQSYAAEYQGVRRYQLVDLQLRHGKDTETVDITCIYEWSGYAAYCDKNSTPYSTLECKNYGTRSIHLELLQTNYRAATQADGTTQDEINSVFMTIPEEYFLDFGNLYQMQAEWYEYKTEPIFVTTDTEAYLSLLQCRNKNIDEYGKDKDGNGPFSDYRILWELNSPTVYRIYFGSGYNAKCIDNLPSDNLDFRLGYHNGDKDSFYCQHQLNWLFCTTSVEKYCVNKTEMLDYIKRYTMQFSSEELIRGKYSSSLFTNSIDSDRLEFLEDKTQKNGLVKMTFTSGENFDENVGNKFIDSEEVQSAWNKFWFGTKYEPKTFSPIVTISEGAWLLTDEKFADDYFVNINDVSTIKQRAKEAYSKGERPVLLRFAVTDYISYSAIFDKASENQKHIANFNGYVAQETVFLDFDILSMKFQSEDGYTDIVIGVVSEPIDIINGLTPPENLVQEQDWFLMLVMLLILAIVGVYFWPFISPIVTMIWQIFFEAFKIGVRFIYWLLRLPFRIIAWFFY